MVEASPDQGSPSKKALGKVYSNRYLKQEEVGHGSFATVYKCVDLLKGSEGRFMSQECLDMLQIIARDSPEIEFV